MPVRLRPSEAPHKDPAIRKRTGPHSWRAVPRTFNSSWVLGFQINGSSCDGVRKSPYFIFESLEFYMSTSRTPRSLYNPAQFDTQDFAVALQIMRAHPLAQLISVQSDGFPFVSHLPLHWEPCAAQENSQLTEPGQLLGHCARGNQHWKLLTENPQALVTFMGPQAYLSPKVYPDLVRVPTWNYIALHCHVQAVVLDDPAVKDALLKQLIADHEPSYAAQWRGLPQDYTEKMLSGIVAFELKITQWQCKVKVNQHRPESHAAMLHAYDQGDANAQGLAAWMRQMGLGSTAK